ncbi:MAG: cell division protein FtsK [Pseudonocardia sp.]|uniref:FtsK/SpoIIIE domain-containing protein n=1 Tax=Pseudonocardia sp. TaxID=60912 RepID=UPI001AC6CC02|nr:FtsK/SpoIIIE domain-containing protein [Pseudonocardia sp.]MBN9101788.1 cell division protein FtsK [Pseudonocardia sp.]
MSADLDKGVELSPAPGDKREIVDPPALPKRLVDAIERRRLARRHPVIPEIVATREAARALAGDLGGHVWFLARFHGFRVPGYAARLVWRSPVGLYRLARVLVALVTPPDEKPLMSAAVRKEDAGEYMKLRRLHAARVRVRLVVALVLLVSGIVALLVARAWAPGWLVATTAVTAVIALGVYGQRKDAPIVSRAVDLPAEYTRPTAEQIETALQSLGVAALTAKGARIGFASPVRDTVTGWVVSIDLPVGATPEMVMDKRAPLASGLRRPTGCVWPDADPSVHGGRLELTVLKQEMSKQRAKPWPLRKNGTADIFGVLPFGVDQRSQPVGIPLIESNMLIGSLPGAGKTASLRCVLLGAALDPTVELHIFELKGSGDLESFERIAHRYASGVDDESVGAALAGLRWLLDELGRRSKKLKALREKARDLVPDSKVTRQLADRRDLGLHPIVFVVDEAQELFAHDDYGKEAGDLATRIIKRARALGVMTIFATQRPDKDSLPTGVSANVGTRFCLRVMGQVENDMVLGTSSYKNGIRATSFTRSDRGIGYLVGATDAPVVVRSYYLDATDSDAVVARAYATREAAGLLSGHAAGDQTEPVTAYNLLHDVETVFATAERVWFWSEDLVERLASLRPDIYKAWNTDVLARNLRALGVETRQINRVGPDGERANRKGIELEQLRTALADHAARLVIEG